MELRKALESINPYIAGKLKPGAIKLASNENPLGPSPAGIQAIRENAAGINLYPDALAGNLREKLAPRLGVSPEEIIVGNGSDEIILFIAGAYIEEGRNAVTSETTFSEYTFGVTLFGGSMKYAPMQDGTFQLTEIRKLIDENTAIVFLCNPNNPTGTYFPESALVDFLNDVPETVLVVIDEAYHEYVRAEDYPNTVRLLDRFPNLMVLRTFSKIYGLAGLRIGYGISSEKIIGDLRKTKEPFNVNMLAQAAALAALDDEDFLLRSIAVNEEGKSFLYKEFDALGLSYYPTEANFICVKIDMDAMEAFRKIMDLGVTIRPLVSFGLNTWIRVTVGTAEQNRKFISCLKQVLQGQNAVPSV